jgi:tRNA(Ile)-lysidine synthase
LKKFSPEALWGELGSPDRAGRARYCVAFSGGMDSTVLLVAMCRLAGMFPPDALRAAHVHHGLHPHAETWAARCRELCTALDVPLAVLRIDARPAQGESPEAKARDARYAALRAALAPGEVLLTAHHADDQLETVLIQLLRGAGVAGLAAMPQTAEFGPGRHCRPLLAFTRAALRNWAEAQELSWIEDPANDEMRYSRNHLRSAVLPAIRGHWPGAAAAAARAARHCAEAARVLDELAAEDAATCQRGEALSLSAMRELLSPARRRNLVRWQCRRAGLPVPDERRLETLLSQFFTAGPDMQPEVRWPGVIALRHADGLWLIPEGQLQAPPAPLAWTDPSAPLELGAGLGSLSLEPAARGGLGRVALDGASWRVRFRGGGERVRLSGRSGSRALKKLLHEAGVPPWLRARMPLIEIDGRLAAVAGLWVDQAWCAPPGTQGWRVAWRGCTLPGAEAFVVGTQAF